MRSLFVALVLVASTGMAHGADRLDLGTTPTPQELSRFFAIPPNGDGLPPGRGTVAAGATIYAEHCAACHGDDLRGKSVNPLIGGRGSLRSSEPLQTIESYWPYATTIFDYVKRAMPIDAPGSLSNDQIYSVTAFILFKAHIIDSQVVIDAKTLPRIHMPNRAGFSTGGTRTRASRD